MPLPTITIVTVGSKGAPLNATDNDNNLINLRNAILAMLNGSFNFENGAGFGIQDVSGNNVLYITPGSSLTNDRTLTIDTGDANREIDISSPVTNYVLTYNGTKLVLSALPTAAAGTPGIAPLATLAQALAGTDNASIITAADLAYAAAALINARHPSQGIYCTSGTTPISIAENAAADLGTSNFSLDLKVNLPSYVASTTLAAKNALSGTYTGFDFKVSSSGYLVLDLYRGDAGTAYTSTVTTGLAAGTPAELSVVVTRETAAGAGSVVFYINGIQLGASVPITLAATASITNANPMYLLGAYDAGTRYAGTIYAARLFNRALASAEIFSLYQSGIDYLDKWGSQIAAYTSNFSATADSWTATAGAVAGNIDSIGGQNDTLRFTADGTAGPNIGRSQSGMVARGYFLINFSLYVPSTNTTLTGVNITVAGGNVLSAVFCQPVANTWTAYSILIETAQYGTPAQWYFYARNATNVNSATNGDVFYLLNVTMTKLGALAAYEGEGVQPNPGQWLDASTNKMHALQPASGTSPVRQLRTFEARDTLTWSGTSDAKYIGGNVAVLPANAFIDDIEISASTGSISVQIGDGSAVARWVATAALSAGMNGPMTLANRASDGTNYKLVVTPSGNYTGSMAFTVRGHILQV